MARLLTQKREHTVKCEAFEDIDSVFASLESWRTKKLTSAENILFRDLGQKRNRTLGEKADPRELKMLEKERRAYISCVVSAQKELLPRELADPKAFESRLDERLRKTTIKKKKKEDGQTEGKPAGQEGADEAEDESNLFESEESEETDDVSPNPDYSVQRQQLRRWGR